MSGSISLSNPFVISNLPSIAGVDSRKQHKYVHATSVLTPTSTATKKRKRTEIAVAVEAQGINIINVQGNKISSTYSLPPATSFSCPPISTKSNKDSRRRTYASISSPQKRLVGWEETSLKRGGTGTSSAPSPASSEYDGFNRDIQSFSRDIIRDERIVRLDFLPRSKRTNTTVDKASGDVLAVHENGLLACFSSDLKTERWTFHVGQDKGLNVLFATTLSSVVARRTIFKNRTDILTMEGEQEEVILLTISCAGESKMAEIHCFAIQPSTSLGNVRALSSTPFRLSDDVKGSWFEANLSYHATSGLLHVSLRSLLITFDLIPTIPKVTSEIDLTLLNPQSTQNASDSILRISSSNVLVARAGRVYLCDVTYKSVHASVTLTEEHNKSNDVELLTYMQDISLIIARNKNVIIGIQILKTGGFVGTTLMDSLCKGIETSSLENRERTSQQAQYILPTVVIPAKRIKKSKSKLSIRASSDVDEELQARDILQQLKSQMQMDDVTAFEETFLGFVGLQKVDPHAAADEHAIVNIPDFMYPDNDDDLALKRLSHTFVTKLLSFIFKNEGTEGKGSPRVKMTFYPPRVLKFLLSNGYFSSANLPNQGSGLTDALVNKDMDLNLLQMVLELAKSRDLPLHEVVHAVQIVLERLDDKSRLTNGTTTDAVHDVSGSLAANINMTEDHLQEAEEAIEKAQHLLNLNDTKEQILRDALEKINRFPRTAIIQSMRQNLGGAELAALIRILRRELIRDSEERLIQHPDPINLDLDLDVDEGAEEWLGLICDTLSCAIDAAGVTGLLLAKDTIFVNTASSQMDTALVLNTNDNETSLVHKPSISEPAPQIVEEMLLTSLSTEIQTTCKSLESAASMSVILSDLLNRATALKAAGRTPPGYMTQPSTISEFTVLKGPISPPRSKMAELEEKRKAVLPLGYPAVPVRRGKMDSKLQKHKKRDDVVDFARKNRSEQYKKSMMVGPYTLERWNI